jgi:hypothetical protein
MKKRPINPYDFDYKEEDPTTNDPFMYSFDPNEDPIDDENEYENPYEMGHTDDLDTPEGYLDTDDEDESFQSKMRRKMIKRPNIELGRSDSWRETEPYSPIKKSDLPLDKYLEAKKKNIKLDESDLYRIVKKVLQEQENQRYMFFQNLEQIKRQCDLLLEMDENMISQVLESGHDWAQDHIATAKESIDQVFDFFMNESKTDFDLMSDDSMMTEGRKKAGTKLCARGKAAAKSKFKVYPSAYANGYAVQVCKGTKPGTDGKKRCSPPYC